MPSTRSLRPRGVPGCLWGVCRPLHLSTGGGDLRARGHWIPGPGGKLPVRALARSTSGRKGSRTRSLASATSGRSTHPRRRECCGCFCHPGRRWRLEALADEAEVSLGQAHNVKKLLVDREWIGTGPEGLWLTEPEALLSEWAENYNYQRNRARDFYSMKSLAEDRGRVGRDRDHGGRPLRADRLLGCGESRAVRSLSAGNRLRPGRRRDCGPPARGEGSTQRRQP